MKTRLLSLILTVCMLIALCPTALSAEDNTQEPLLNEIIVNTNQVRCYDTVKLVLTDIEGATGKNVYYGGKSGGSTEPFGDKDDTSEKKRHTFTIEGNELKYIRFDQDVRVALSVPEYSDMTTSIDGKTMTVTIKDKLTDIDDFDPTGKTASGTGWSWSDNGKTLTIDSAYVLYESEPIHCEKLVLNGVVKYALMPDLKEIEGRRLNFDGGVFRDAGIPSGISAMKYVTITSDKPFAIGYGEAVFNSENNRLELVTSETELDILSGLDGTSKLLNGAQINGQKLSLQDQTITISDASTDQSWRESGVITNADQLNDLAFLVNHGGSVPALITLGADIDLSEIEFTPIGNTNTPFVSIFDGNSHTIKLGRLKGMTDADTCFGLFGALGSGAVVKNLAVDGELTASTDAGDAVFSGGIAGIVNSGAKLLNCVSSVALNVTANRINSYGSKDPNALYVGGLVGKLGGEILNSAFLGGNGSLNGESTSIKSAPIAAGVTSRSEIENCYHNMPGMPVYAYGTPNASDNNLSTDNGGAQENVDKLNKFIRDNSITGAESWIVDKDGNPTLKTFCQHNFKWVIDIEATYTSTGLKHEECTICKTKRNENTVIDKLSCNHNFKWIIDREPTYTSTGLKHEECTICKATRSENTVIDKLEREDTPVIVMPAYVNFETNGGEKLDTLVTLFGAKIDLMKYIPTRDGYEFDGWYKDEELTEFVSEIRAVGTTTVYAKWVREELPFTDIDRDHKYYDDIAFVYDEGLMIGTSGTKFSPDRTLTRGMVTTILWRMSGSPVVNFLMDFTDVDEEAYYGEAIRWAEAEKIVNGVGDKRFDPEGEVTREQLATIIYRYVQRNGGGFKGMWYFPLRYDDAAEISEYANEAMHWCVMNGIIEADEDNNLRPTAPATRAETAHAYHILSIVNG